MNSAVASAITRLENRVARLTDNIRRLDSMVCEDAESLDAALNSLLDQQLERDGVRIRIELLRAYAEVLDATPARSGQARAGWTFSEGDSVPEPHWPRDRDKDEYLAERVDAAVREALDRLPDDVFATVTLGNAVPYLPLLEAGESPQAAAGFVAAAMAALEARLQRLG